MEKEKTYRFGVTHTEYGYVDIKAENIEKAKELAEADGCMGMEVNKCDFELGSLIEII